MIAGAAHLTEAQLGELADGTLGGVEREAAERHVAGCGTCRHAVAESRAVLAMARQARGGAGVTAPPELWPLVAASTVHAARLRRHTIRSMRGVLALTAAALVLGTAAATTLVVTRLRPAPRRAAPSTVERPPGPVGADFLEARARAERAMREADEAMRRAEEARREAERLADEARALGERAARGDPARRDVGRGDPSRRDVGRGDPSRRDGGPPPAPRPPAAPRAPEP